MQLVTTILLIELLLQMNAYVNLPAERMGLNRTMHLSIGPL